VVSSGSRVNGSKTAVPATIVLVIFTAFMCGAALATAAFKAPALETAGGRAQTVMGMSLATARLASQCSTNAKLRPAMNGQAHRRAL
jgi:hypothetical protein